MRKLTNTFISISRKIIYKIIQFVKWVKTHRKLSQAINWLLVVILLIYFYLAFRNDFQLFVTSLEETDPVNLIYSALLYGLNFIIFFEIWRILLQAFNIKLEIKRSLKVFSRTYLSKFIPSPIFFYISRISQLGKLGIDSKNSLSLTAFEFLFQVLSGFGILGIINVKFSDTKSLLWLLLLFPILILCLKPNLLNLNYILGDAFDINFNLLRIIRILLLGTLPWIIGGAFFLFIIKTIDVTQDFSNFSDLLRIWILTNLASMIGSYVLGGLGILRELTLVISLQKFFPPTTAILIAGAVRILLFFLGILWAILCYFFTILIEPSIENH